MKYYRLSEDEQPSVHDAIYDGLHLHMEEVEENHVALVFESVPKHIFELANDWYWGDTEVRDELYIFAKNFRFK